ncbi:MAG: NUDIX domain-containing protein [Clostridia bacterium]|nr:NUDIX domain-containing protein [Clostridia bacterium]
MNWEKSCGAIVFTRREDKVLFVIVQELAGAYSFPKGHMEHGETERETACREVFEEIGLHPVLLNGFREMDEYDLLEKPGTRKQVVYFLAEYGNDPLVIREGEIRRVLLAPYEEAEQYFEHESTRRILRAAYDFVTQGSSPACR